MSTLPPKEEPKGTLPETTSATATATETATPTAPSQADSKPGTGPVDEMERRREFVKKMVKKAWKSAKSALVDNSILSIKRSSSSRIRLRDQVSEDSLVNAMTTFAVLGMEEEFNLGTKWVETQLEIDKLDKDLDVSRVIINYIGGLLSCFALTWNRVFLDKAEQLANKLEPAYRSNTGLPFHSINPVTGQATGSLVWLSELTTGRLEYAYLSDVTDDPRYKRRCELAQEFLDGREKPRGLYPWKVDIETGEWASTTATLAFPSRYFYQNLVKGHLYSQCRDMIGLQRYAEAVEAAEVNRMLATAPSGLLYARNLDTATDTFDDFMSSSSAYLGALFALGANAMQAHKKVPEELVQKHWRLAHNIAETCHEASQRTATKLLPGRFYFNAANDATNSSGFDREHSLSPELAESYFVLWRLTKQPKYRQYAWELAQAMAEHCQDKNGFWDLLDVDTVPSRKAPIHDPFLIGGTLKYLYLTFCEDHILPLDMWVFNAAGNPLPIGAHEKGLQQD